MDAYCPPAAYAQVFQETSQPSVSPSDPQSTTATPSAIPSESVVPQVPSNVPQPTEWHRQVEPSVPVAPASGLDSSASENSVLFRFIFAQFAAIQTKIDSKFASLERSVDSKLEQLQVKLERHITEYSYNQASKLHNMEKHLSEQLNVVRKDHFHANKRFRQLVDEIREVLFSAG